LTSPLSLHDALPILLSSPRAVVADQNGNTETKYQGMVIKTADGIVLNPIGQIEVAELPPGLISKPSLLWKLETNKPGAHKTEVRSEEHTSELQSREK